MDLPAEIIAAILADHCRGDRASFARVCRLWRDTIADIARREPSLVEQIATAPRSCACFPAVAAMRQVLSRWDPAQYTSYRQVKRAQRDAIITAAQLLYRTGDHPIYMAAMLDEFVDFARQNGILRTGESAGKYRVYSGVNPKLCRAILFAIQCGDMRGTLPYISHVLLGKTNCTLSLQRCIALLDEISYPPTSSQCCAGARDHTTAARDVVILMIAIMEAPFMYRRSTTTVVAYVKQYSGARARDWVLRRWGH